MRTRMWMLMGAAICAAFCSVQPAPAEITSITGTASATIQEYVADVAGDIDQASKTFPGTSDTLPLQVVARLLSQTQKAGALAAVQLENPLTSTIANPQEFALDLVLDSLTPTTRYTGTGFIQEVRGVLYTPEEIGGTANGERLRFTGRMFLDGALVMFATTNATDLTGTSVAVRVTVVKEVAGEDNQTVFDGTLSATGSTDRQVRFTAEGSLPTSGIIDTDLAGLNPDLGVLRVIVLPNLAIDYPYEAVIGQEFTLRATIQVEAAHRADGVGVGAILGLPLDTIIELLTITRSSATAKTINDAVNDERADPSGEPAFPQTLGVFPACGLFGFESLLGVAGLLGMWGWRARRVIRC